MLQKSLRRDKKKSLLSIVKNIIKREKMLYYNYKKVFQFRKLCIQNIRNFFRAGFLGDFLREKF